MKLASISQRAVLVGALALGAAGIARADEFAIKLKPGEGQETTQQQCAACHSVDYIVTNSKFLNGKGWNAEVSKMIHVFGANISPDDAKAIEAYLTKNYGT
jgi:sulfite dehydrogenase (cytochrome) subunit B